MTVDLEFLTNCNENERINSDRIFVAIELHVCFADWILEIVLPVLSSHSFDAKFFSAIPIQLTFFSKFDSVYY